MSVHNRHPSIREHGLADGCERCDEHAANPFNTLDDENLRALVNLTLAWMGDQDMPRSRAELKAMRVVEQAVRYARVLNRLGVEVPA